MPGVQVDTAQADAMPEGPQPITAAGAAIGAADIGIRWLGWESTVATAATGIACQQAMDPVTARPIRTTSASKAHPLGRIEGPRKRPFLFFNFKTSSSRQNLSLYLKR